MAKRISDTKPVTEFMEVARTYCLLIEKSDEKTDIELLQEMFVLLPQICLCGARLPDVQRLSRQFLLDYSPERWRSVSLSLRTKFGKHDVYREVFDPYDQKDRKAIHGVLSGDLSEIYSDLERGLNEWGEADAVRRRDIIWNWKFGFENHWGHHAADAFRALYWLLYNHIKDEDGAYVGIG